MNTDPIDPDQIEDGPWDWKADGYGGRTNRYPLSRGHIKIDLIRKLATMEHTDTELAEQYGVAIRSIGRFRERNIDEIVAVRGQLHDQFAGLWVVDKARRVAELQADIEQLSELAALDGGEASDMVPDFLRLKHAALRGVAEEMGQLPARMSIKVEGSIRHELIGVDPDVDLT